MKRSNTNPFRDRLSSSSEAAYGQGTRTSVAYTGSRSLSSRYPSSLPTTAYNYTTATPSRPPASPDLTITPSPSPPPSAAQNLRIRKSKKNHGVWCRVKTRLFPEVRERENFEKEKEDKRERKWRETETAEFLKTNRPMERDATGELVGMEPLDTADETVMLGASETRAR